MSVFRRESVSHASQTVVFSRSRMRCCLERMCGCVCVLVYVWVLINNNNNNNNPQEEVGQYEYPSGIFPFVIIIIIIQRRDLRGLTKFIRVMFMYIGQS